jgi:hypothetical protein
LQGLDKVSFQPIDDFDPETIQRLNTYAREGPTLAIKTLGIDVDGASIPSNDFGFLDSSGHPQVWQLASFPKPGNLMEVNLYQWLLPPDFALHWFQQGGDADPRIARYPSDTPATTGGALIDWPQTSTPEAMQQALAAENVEYIFANPELVNSQPNLFAPFMTTDGARLRLNQLPPGWRLAFVYPDLNCEWCLFQLRPPDHPIQLTFGESIELEGYDVSATQLSPGDSLHVTLYWQSLRLVPESYLVFVHLLDENGTLVGQIDQPPLQGKWLTNNWRPGDRLADRHTLSLSPTLAWGNYTVRVGLYNPTTLERMSARGEQNQVLDNAVVLTPLSLE